MTQVNQSCPVSSTLTYAPNLQKMFIWLVVSTPLENTSQLGLLFPRYGKIKKGSKPPTSHPSCKASDCCAATAVGASRWPCLPPVCSFWPAGCSRDTSQPVPWHGLHHRRVRSMYGLHKKTASRSM